MTINFTTLGKRHLGAAIGSADFKATYASEKIDIWCKEILNLAEIAKSQSQAAFAAFIHGEQHRVIYFMRTKRDVFSLAIKNGGLGTPIFTEIAGECYRSSREMASSLIAVMVQQNEDLPSNDIMQKTKAAVIKRSAMESKDSSTTF